MISQKYYEILGVNRNSTENDIKLAYRQLAKKYHPDLNKETNAKEKFIEIQNAYEKITNQPAEIPDFFKSSTIPSIDDLFKEMLDPNSEFNINWRKERDRPKPMSEILKNLIDKIGGYCLEILDRLFIDTKPEWKETIEDWRPDFEELKQEIYKKEWESYSEMFKDECTYDDNCSITEEMVEKERKKLCKECFEKDRKKWMKRYNRDIDIGFAYLRAYLKATPKYYKPLRKEYNSNKVKTGSVKHWL